MGDFMRDPDAFSWHMERDPALRSTIVVALWLDGPPDWEGLRLRLDSATRQVPIFRQRVVEMPGVLVPPRWTTDASFDLSNHLRRLTAHEPSGLGSVLELVRHEAMTAFDRARPLWQATLVEGLSGGRAALVMKIHHALTDGIGGMQMALLLFDLARSPNEPLAMPEAPRGESPGITDLLRDEMGYAIGRLEGLVRGHARASLAGGLRAAVTPLRSAERLESTVRSIARTVAPLRDTLSPVMTNRGVARSVGLIEVRLEDLKEAAAAAGGTVNDGFISAVTGGLRRYHERNGTQVDRLRMTLPISIRAADDPLGGNRIMLMRFAVPVAEPDPALRIAEIGRLCRQAREEPSLRYTNGIAGVLNLLPSAVVAPMLKRIDFCASNVPGFPFPVYLAGARVERYVSFSPTVGTAVNTTLLSYNGTCYVGVNVDSAAVPDHDVLLHSLVQGFEEVLLLGGHHRRARLGRARPNAA